MKLTSFQRFQLTKLWLKRGRQEDLETFIKQVCTAKEIEYVPPRKTKS